MENLKLDALALKYKRESGGARRYVDISDVRNYPVGKGVGRVFGPGFFEEVTSIGSVERGVFGENTGNPRLISKNSR